uniref:spastin n=1 Tax=Erigeron canadensis TaxID=72917 RepID=UPI001CB9022C|nr:spastin [Erigeron canadensis]
MSNEAPKLYIHKPKKSKLKKHHQMQPSPATAGSSAAAAPPRPPIVPPAPPIVPPAPPIVPPAPPTISPAPPKESFARRYKFMWPLLLAVNFSIGAYLFMRTKNKENMEEVAAVASTPTSAISAASVAVVGPVKQRAPIPLDQQLELFKWILEEKRKIKPKDPGEKKKIDEEKAILKQFIRAKPVSSL